MYKMATVESGTTGAKEDQENTSSEEGTVLCETPTPQDFSELTPSHFGISVQSFTPSSSNLKDKSRLAQIKARRRSSVGVRGSPETNSLIRFIAQQRMKTPLTPQTPELVRSSPFFPRVASTLRQKMASFQNLMDVVESDACDPVPVQDSNSGGCIMTRDYLSDGNSCGKGKENSPPTEPTPCKKRCLGPTEGCSVEIREAHSFIPHCSLKEQEGAVCEHQSPIQSASNDPAAPLPPQQSPPLHIHSLPSLNEMKPTEDESTSTSKVKKRKQVRFGGPLSPEFFDKNLPPITPLRKGGTPARASTPGESLQLRSVLKTPQRSESNTPQYQPERHSPTEFGASPTLTIPCRHEVLSEGDDSEDGKIVFSSAGEMDFAVTSDTEFGLDVQPLNLNSAFHEETLSQVLTVCETKSSQTSQMDVMDESESDEKKPEADAESLTPTRSSRRKKKTAQEPKTEPQACSRKRKRKLAEESEPVKRSTRSAAKSACGKMKEASSAARRWNKDVDRSLYGSRAYASKNPSLSPIRERLSFTGPSPASQQTPESCTASNQETLVVLEMTNDSQTANDPAVTEVVEKTSKGSGSSPSSDKEKNRKVSRSVVRRRGRRKRIISVTDSEEQTGEKTEQHFEDQSSSNFKSSGETPSKPSKSHQGNSETEELGVQFSVDAPCTDRETSEYHESLDASTPYCPPSSEESSNTAPEQRRAKQGRRSPALQEPLKYAEKHQSSCDVDENALRDQADGQHQNIQSSSDSQEDGGGADEVLAPWQADFNFEDVFEPAARRGQRSVRRSLRNQCVPEHRGTGAGLAWLPRTSPDSVKESRRKSRQRRLSSALPAQPLLPEETQDAPLNELRLKGAN